MDISQFKLEERTQARLVYNKETLEILGHFKDWREENPNESLMSQSKFGSVRVGYIVGIDYDKHERELLGLEQVHANMIQRYLDDEKHRRELAEPKANALLDEAEGRLNELETLTGVSVTYRLEGDLWGVDDYPCLRVEVDGFLFERKL